MFYSLATCSLECFPNSCHIWVRGSFPPKILQQGTCKSPNWYPEHCFTRYRWCSNANSVSSCYRTPFLFSTGHTACGWVRNEFHLSPERIRDTAIVLQRGKFCEDCPGKARSTREDTGLNQSAERGTGQTWSKSDDKSWDLIINWMQLFSAVEVLGEIASRTKLTISLIVSLSPFLQCRSLSQTDSGSFFLMEPRVNCVSCLQISSPEHRSLPMAIQLSIPCPHPTRLKMEEGLHLLRIGANLIFNSNNERRRHFEHSRAPGLCVTVSSGTARGWRWLRDRVHQPPPPQSVGPAGHMLKITNSRRPLYLSTGHAFWMKENDRNEK